MRGLSLGIIPLLLFLGCATTEDVSYLQHRLYLLEERVVELSKADKALSENLKRSKADLETDLEALRGEVRALKDDLQEKGELLERLLTKLEDLEGKISALQKRPPPAPAPPPPPPTTPEELYHRAYEAFKAKDYPRASSLFQEFLTKYPSHELADNAHFWLGECYYAQKDYEKAILAYEKVLTHYPKGDKVPSALLKEGLAFLEIGDKINGVFLLEKVLKEYPATLQAEIAKRKLDLIKSKGR